MLDLPFKPVNIWDAPDTRYQATIEIIPQCPFIDVTKRPNCYKFTLYSQRFDTEDNQWYYDGHKTSPTIIQDTYQLPFYAYSEFFPKLDFFIDSIKAEIKAVKYIEDTITPLDVYNYAIPHYQRIGSPKIDTTINFLMVYAEWEYRLENTLKFCNRLTKPQEYSIAHTTYFYFNQ